MDVIDEANALADRERESCIARVAARVAPKPVLIENRTCRACGDWIGMERIEAVPNALHCIACAKALEESQRKRR